MLIILLLIFIIEQIPYQKGYKWTKTEHISRLASYKIPEGCSVIYFDIKPVPKDIIDIMWISDIKKVRTANGYSGYIPYYINGTVPEKCTFTIEK